jgi:hypothetical protein
VAVGEHRTRRVRRHRDRGALSYVALHRSTDTMRNDGDMIGNVIPQAARSG